MLSPFPEATSERSQLSLSSSNQRGRAFLIKKNNNPQKTDGLGTTSCKKTFTRFFIRVSSGYEALKVETK